MFDTSALSQKNAIFCETLHTLANVVAPPADENEPQRSTASALHALRVGSSKMVKHWLHCNKQDYAALKVSGQQTRAILFTDLLSHVWSQVNLFREQRFWNTQLNLSIRRFVEASER